MLTELANMRVPVHDFINQLAVTKLQLTCPVCAPCMCLAEIGNGRPHSPENTR